MFCINFGPTIKSFKNFATFFKCFTKIVKKNSILAKMEILESIVYVIFQLFFGMEGNSFGKGQNIAKGFLKVSAKFCDNFVSSKFHLHCNIICCNGLYIDHIFHIHRFIDVSFFYCQFLFKLFYCVIDNIHLTSHFVKIV